MWQRGEAITSYHFLAPKTPETDCRSVRPSFKRPTGLDAPQFVRVRGGRLATVPPLGPVEFVVTPRVLPPPTDFSVRVDSSMAQAGESNQTIQSGGLGSSVRFGERGGVRFAQMSICQPRVPSPPQNPPLLNPQRLAHLPAQSYTNRPPHETIPLTSTGNPQSQSTHTQLVYTASCNITRAAVAWIGKPQILRDGPELLARGRKIGGGGGGLTSSVCSITTEPLV